MEEKKTFFIKQYNFFPDAPQSNSSKSTTSCCSHLAETAENISRAYVWEKWAFSGLKPEDGEKQFMFVYEVFNP